MNYFEYYFIIERLIGGYNIGNEHSVYFKMSSNEVIDPQKGFNGAYFIIPKEGTYKITEHSYNFEGGEIKHFKKGELIKVPNYNSKTWKVLFGEF